jgi:hypothetical protein
MTDQEWLLLGVMKAERAKIAKEEADQSRG